MHLGSFNGVLSMTELQRSSGVAWGKVDQAFGGEKKWGKGCLFVWQDKASAVQCRRFAVFSNILTAFPPLQGIRSGQLYSTAKSASWRAVQRLHFRRLGHARRPLLVTTGSLIAMASLVVFGKVFGLRISLTDSAAPAGIYRTVPEVSVQRGDLVGACLPPSIAQEGLARGYLQKGDCPGGAEPVAKIIGALSGDVLDVQPGWVSVNGRKFADSAVAVHDSSGRPLPHVPWGRRQVAPGEVWLFGFHNVRSWDARYFGPVPLSSLRGVLKPILTW